MHKVLLFLTIAVAVVSAQNYPPTARVPVTFSDYTADETNPNFQSAGLCSCIVETLVTTVPDTMIAGDTVALCPDRIAMTHCSMPDTLPHLVTWSATASPGETLCVLLDGAGPRTCNRLSCSYAYAACHVTATCTDTVADSTWEQSWDIEVGPLAEYRISVEAQPEGSPWLFNNIVNMRMLVGDSTPVYALIRDGCGNFVEWAGDAVWSSSDTAVISVTPARDSLGEAIVAGRANGEGVIVACAPVYGNCDTVDITVVQPAAAAAPAHRRSDCRAPLVRAGRLFLPRPLAGPSTRLTVYGLDGARVGTRTLDGRCMGIPLAELADHRAALVRIEPTDGSVKTLRIALP